MDYYDVEETYPPPPFLCQSIKLHRICTQCIESRSLSCLVYGITNIIEFEGRRKDIVIFQRFKCLLCNVSITAIIQLNPLLLSVFNYYNNLHCCSFLISLTNMSRVVLSGDILILLEG